MGKKLLSTENFENLWSFACNIFKYRSLEDDNIKFLNDIKT